jgi:hypothetical protein
MGYSIPSRTSKILLRLFVYCRKSQWGEQKMVRHAQIVVPSWPQFILYLLQSNDKVQHVLTGT